MSGDPLVPSGPEKPVITPRHGKKLLSSTPALGRALKFGLGQPGSGFDEKKLPKHPAGPPPKAMGRMGASNESWSTVPPSSLTHQIPYPPRTVLLSRPTP